MPAILLMPLAVTVDASPNEPLLEVVKRAGFAVETPCGGKGICGKCLVRVTAGMVTQPPNAALSEGKRTQGWVLLCQACVGDTPATVEIVSHMDAEQGQFSDTDGDFAAVDPALRPMPADFSPLVQSAVLTVKTPVAGDGLSDFDRLRLAVCAAQPCRDIRIPLPVLNELPETLRAASDCTLYYSTDGDVLHIADILPGINEAAANVSAGYGLAVDIGTTTVAMALTDAHGRVLGIKTGYNAQIACGLDVISRINYAKTPARRAELKEAVLRTVNTMMAELCAQHGASPSGIVNISVAANTTMTQMLLGTVPEYIRLSPYTPAIYNVPRFTAYELGLMIAPGTPVYFAPAVGSYVGGDITSGILCTSLAAPVESLDESSIYLLIDIGTNGEIVLGGRDFMMACACSAGPAFEGGGVSCGMRASVGAVENVIIDGETGAPSLSVIGGGLPKGICGSGMIALTAELFRKGLLDPAGKLSSHSRYVRDRQYILANEALDGGMLSVSEADIQNLIRAKAAVFSACRTLLNSVGFTFDDLTRIYVAGGFGRFLNLRDAETIGLMPPLTDEKVHFLGNASLSGAYMTLISEKHRRLQSELAAKITYIDLSGEPSYMDEYTAALFLPHTDGRLFNNL